MNSPVPLFRDQALSAQGTQSLGTIVLLRPLSFWLVTLVLSAFVLAVCLFLAFGSYTKRTAVSGQLMPETGLINLYVPDAGIVLERPATLGQQVAAGDVLYILSGDRQSALGNTQESISQQIRQRELSLQQARAKTAVLQTGERDILAASISNLKARLAAIDSQMDGQRGRITLAQESARRYQGLTAKGYLSAEEYDQKRAELLEQRNQLQALERERLSMSMDLSTAQARLSDLALTQQNQLAQLDRELAGVAVELTQSEARRRIIIKAPQAGVLTALTAEPGQAVTPQQPLASIMPEGAELVAELYAPSRAIGFVAPGDAVRLRLAAYPYQTFGQQTGTVKSVSRSALPAWQDGAAAGEASYRITVALDGPPRGPQGQTLTLRPGMRLDADLLQQTRRLYQWALDPANRLAGRL